VSFVTLVLHNVSVRKVRLAFTALAVAIGVMAVVALGVLTSSLETSELAIMQTGRADFTVAQKNVADLLASSIDEDRAATIAAEPGVASVVGVLIGTEKLNADNPQFLEVGIDPARLADFGVNVVAGQPFTTSAKDQIMLGWRAAENLHKHVGDTLTIGNNNYRVTGIYSTGQALGDLGGMLPLAWFQTYQRQPGQFTLLFVRVRPGTNVPSLQARVDADNPQLTTVRTVEQFGRADRSLALIRAAARGSTVLAIAIGAIVVMSAMTITFVERLREFGVLAAIGWPRWRIMAMIICEALIIGLLGAAGGSFLAWVAVRAVQHLPSLKGVLHPVFRGADYTRALATAAAMSLLGGLYPALRAALTQPMEQLRNE
jgi:putative ABC transport system permease protein